MAIKFYRYEMSAARFRFATQVYAFVAIMLICTFFEWSLARECDKFQNWLIRFPKWSIFFLLLGLLTLCILTNVTKIRTKLGVNWALFIIAMELFILGFSFAIVKGPSYWFQTLFFALLFYDIIIIISAHLTPFDITRFVLGVFSLMIFLFLFIIIFAIFSVIVETFLVIKIIFVITVMLILNVIQFYSAQVTQGGRFLELRTNELVLPVAISYYHVIISFILFYLIIEPESPGLTAQDQAAIDAFLIAPISNGTAAAATNAALAAAATTAAPAAAAAATTTAATM